MISHSWPASAIARSRRPRLSLQMRLVLVVLACVLPLSALSLGMQLVSYRNARAAAGQRTLEFAHSFASALDRELQVRISSLQDLALSTRLRNGDVAGFRDRASALVAQHLLPGSHIILLREDGQQVMNTGLPPDAKLPVRTNLDTIQRVFATGQPSVSGVFNAAADGLPTVAIEVPVLGPNGGVAYVLALNPPFAAFSEIIRRQHASESWVAVLMDDRGTIVARDPAGFIGQPAPPEFMVHLLTAQQGIVETISLDGTAVLSAFSHSEKFGWRAGVGLPMALLTAQPWRAAIGTLAAEFAVLVASLIAAGVVAHRITSPISALRRIAAAAEIDPADELLASSLREAGEVAEALAVAARERQLALEAGAIGIFNLDLQAGQLRWDDRMRAMWAVPKGGFADISTFYAGIHPDYRAAITALLDTSMSPIGDGVVAATFHVVGLSDGTRRIVSMRAKVISNDGRPARMLGTAIDITERRAAEERQALLAREVDHRAKNVLAVVQSIVRMTPRTVAPQDFAASVEGRITAMARAHSVLAAEQWVGADLQMIAEGESAAYADRVNLEGIPARLAPAAAQPVAMLLHELVTNAAKHGALSQPGGTVRLSWRFMPDGALRLCWTEQGGPASETPGRAGFGSRLITSLGERQLGGTLQRQWRPAGLALILTLPAQHARARVGAPVLPWADLPWAELPAGDTSAPARLEHHLTTSDGRVPQVLVVEDEALLAMELEQTVGSLGCKVIGPAHSLAEAVRLAAGSPRPDAAVLDINLAGEMVFPAADILLTRGIPMVFTTSYGNTPVLAGYDIEAATVLRKPYSPKLLSDALSRALRVKTP